MPTITGTPPVRFNCNAPSNMKALHTDNWQQRSYPVTAIMRRGEVFKVPTGLSCPLPWWDASANRAEWKSLKSPADKEQAKAFNKSLDEWEAMLTKIWNENDTERPENRHKLTFTPNRFKSLVEDELKKGKAKEIPSLLEFVSQYIHQRAKDREKANTDPWRHSTISQMVSEYKRLAAYSKQHGQPHWEEITPQWLQRYISWLYKPAKSSIIIIVRGKKKAQVFTKRALNMDSARQSVTLLKQFVRAAALLNYVSSVSVADLSLVRLQGGETDSHFYHWREVKAMLETDLSGRSDFFSLHRVRLLVFVGVFTGLRFSDYSSLKKSNVYPSNTTGEDLLDIVTKKKKKKVAIRFIPIFRQILDAVDWKIDKSGIGDFNQGVKRLVQFACPERMVTCNDSTGGVSSDPIERPFCEVVASHCGRRTAAQLQSAMGATMNQIRKTLGHGAESMTAHYMSSDDFSDAANVNSHEMAAMKDFLNGNADFSAFLSNHAAYLKRKEFPNYEYWQAKRHEPLLSDGYALHDFDGRFSTPNMEAAKKVVIEKHKEKCYARVVWGYETEKNKRLFSVIFKPKSSASC